MHRNTQETLQILDRLDLDTDKLTEEDIMKRFGLMQSNAFRSQPRIRSQPKRTSWSASVSVECVSVLAKDSVSAEEDIMKRFGLEDTYKNGELSCWQNVKPRIWALFEEPNSSPAAKVSYF